MAARNSLHLVILFAFVISAVTGGNELGPQELNFDDDEIDDTLQIEEDLTWPGLARLGQVSAVAVDGRGRLHVFHRGNRVWDGSTFNENYQLRHREEGPIPNDTVLVLDAETEDELYSWGADRFYVPHGLTVDNEGNSWITDVGLHQVFKFGPNADKPSLVLGVPFTPGAGKNHFCQPTDVAVTSEGHFFVSDGYCNSRLVLFTQEGRFVMEIGAKDGMNVPHSLTLIPDHDAVCTADRENWRILCYSAGLKRSLPGNQVARIEGQGLGRVFAIDRRGSLMFAVNGPERWKKSHSLAAHQGIIIDIETGIPQHIWGPEEGFHEPHDLAVSPDGKYVFVSEIDISAPKRVYKFKIFD